MGLDLVRGCAVFPLDLGQGVRHAVKHLGWSLGGGTVVGAKQVTLFNHLCCIFGKVHDRCER